MKLKFLLLGSVFISVLNNAQVEKSISLNELEVVADWQKEFAEAGQSVQVLTKDQIQAMPVQSLDALLESIAGIDVRQRGVGGTQADLSLRGGTFDQVLVLLNGVSITDPQTGHHLLDLPIDFTEIDRVEVLQGSAARKYGNQAFSGAINIVTLPQNKPKFKVDLSAGSFNTFAQKASVSGGNQNLKGFFSISRNSSDGYINNTDFQHFNAFGQLIYKPQNFGQFDMQFGYQNKSFGANGFYTLKYPNQFEHTQTKFASLKWGKKMGDFLWNASASWRNHYDRFELFRDNVEAPVWYVSHNYHLTDVYNAKMSLTYFSELGKFNLGLGNKYDRIYSTVLGDPLTELIRNEYQDGINFTKAKDRSVNELNLEYTKKFNQFNLASGFSVNQSNTFGWQWHYGADLSWKPTDLTSYYLSLNTASRLPTFTDLYYQSATQIANPNLLPEKSMNLEIGNKYAYESFKIEANIFHRRADNVIDWVLLQGESKWQSRNLTQLNTTGLELDANYQLDKYGFKNVKLSYAYIMNDKPTLGFDSKYALDYLKHHVNFSLKQQVLKSMTLDWQINYLDRAGTYTDFASGLLTDYKPYVKIDFKASYLLNKTTIYMDLMNLTNSSYADFGGLIQPGISVNAGIKYELK